MSLPHILLGMLAKPASGYDLKTRFTHSAAHFWSAELSQIYPALSRMEKQGLLHSEKVPSEKGPDRKVYSRTIQGKTELKEWLKKGPISRQDRISFLTQVMFLDAVPKKTRIRFMQELKADFESRLSDLQAIEENWRNKDPRYPDHLPDDAFFHQVTLDLGIRRLGVTVQWCDDCLRRLESKS